ncbi:copper amine oxidase N-terminal domain-containing protein [Paenibacillus sp. BR2-3]|uniref:copper amine oxidase N-terminal domain-containing protein n=1 Tax=Paenibacillus sp. BR2-3 TaxID=3048494 RepID=UPI0039778272
MSRIKFPTAALLLVMLIGIAPLTASAPLSASAATAAKSTNTIKAQSVDVRMVFDGVSLQPPAGQSVFIYNNTIYVPLRFMSYALQKSVTWDAKNSKVAVAEPSGTERVVIKEYLMNATNGNNLSGSAKSVELNAVKASYVFSGSAKSVPSGQSSYMLNGSLYVPLRFLSESVGNGIIWDQKSKTINAASAPYKEQTAGKTTENNGKKPSGAATPAPTGGAAGGSSAGAGTGKASYETITSETEAKLSALQSQSQSALMSIALEYLAAKDDASKASIKARGVQQLASFTSSFNSIVSDAESKLQAGSYDTTIINQYKSEFEAQLQMGQTLAEGMAGQ